MEDILSLKDPLQVSSVVLLLRLIVWAIFKKYVEQWNETFIGILALAGTLILSIVSMFAYFGWNSGWISILKFLYLWLYSTAAVLGIEFTKNVVISKVKI